MGADPSAPKAAATRSKDRVAALPIGAWLSIWLRSLLVLTAGRSDSFFFADANAPREWPCGAYSLILSVPGLFPVRCVPRRVTAALAPELHPSARTLSCGALGLRRSLRFHVPATLSRISSL